MKAPLEGIRASCYTIPTETPESDGTLEWMSTTLVLVEASAGGRTGLGYSYADRTAADLIRSLLVPLVKGRSAFDIVGVHTAMTEAVRNLGRTGIASMAIAAVDTALWDLKAKLLEISLLDLLGAVRERAPIYGSGGFTSYPIPRLQAQLGGWAEEGLRAVKMKVGRDPAADEHRVQAARAAIGPDVELYVDANGAYSPKQALALAERFAACGVTWFEEPVSSDDLAGLRLLRDRAPAPLRIAAGEYGFDAGYFRRMLEAGSVDVLQADATRCAGLTGFLQAGVLAEAFQIPFSFHCAPALHAVAACAVPRFSIGEYFFDHVRIERMLFDGLPEPVKGALAPDRSRPGFGFSFKPADAARYAA